MATLGRDLATLHHYRHLFWLWLRLRIKLRYAQTALGLIWLVLLPLANALVYALAVGEILGASRLVDVPYVPFLLAGQLAFRFFDTVIAKSGTAPLHNVGLSNQVYFPRELLILLEMGEALLDFAIQLLVALAVALLFGIPISLNIVLLPLMLLLLGVWTGALAFLIAWAVVRVRDLQPLLSVLLRLLFFITPIFYTIDRVPEVYRPLIYINPLTPIVALSRTALLGIGTFDLPGTLLSFTLGSAALLLSYRFFKRHESDLVDYQ